MPRHGESKRRAPAESFVSPFDVALWCASQGWPVHPLAPGRKTPAANCDDCRPAAHPPQSCPCGARGKWCHGFHAATTDSARLSAWWGDQPAFGVGVSCGPAGLVVLDVDAHSAEVPARTRLLPGIEIHEQVNLTGLASGFDTLALLAAFRKQPNPSEDETTLRVKTPSGGLHIWYQAPLSGIHYRSSTGSSPKVALAWQVDVRATGGYIVAPATRTQAGTYVPVGPARVPAPLPDWLAAELQRTGHVVSATTVSPPAQAPRHAAKRNSTSAHRLLEPLLAEVEGCAAVANGASFTEKLNRAAYTAGGLVAAGHLTDLQARELLTAAADAARPHQSHRSIAVITSALSAGHSRPLHLKGRP
ncbi:bifunctional DNA primase/polymerase [Streptomyces sp. MB09-01]|uniref:bifunctional DNA primase/polymerase n=1 Tax=Streptomyces sp. MB09-01 TaxID=3028666 RepID=UPI0029A62586|nr:bifunctional DNA primase/polymerase [Streptomyces sp. MB09-01]MDX3539919.1 bifunctional DNA primase/polymerase [Streptomyces sp. MB09-01]